jgi:hypothetical protein
VTLREAAQRLNVDLTIVRRMIPEKKLPASQVVACAPWQIPVEALESETKLIEPGSVQGTNFIEKAFENSKAAPKPPSYQSFVDQSLALYKEPSQLQCATESNAAEAIVAAATDTSGQLRYLVGSDAVMLAHMRWEPPKSNIEPEHVRSRGRIPTDALQVDPVNGRRRWPRSNVFGKSEGK